VSHELGEVVVVEAKGSEGFQRGQVGVPTRGRANAPSGRGEVGVDVGCVEDASSEKLALRLAYGVAAGEHGEVTCAQAFGGEGGGECREVGEWGRDFGVGCA